MIGKNNIGKIALGRRVIAFVARGARIVWQAVRSCFGAGHWRNDKPWSNDEGWQN